MSDYSTIRVQEAAPGVVLVTLNRPEAANALSTAMGRDLLDLWTRLAADPSVRAAVLTGEGRFFCAGADLKERDGMTDEAWAAQHRLFEDMIRAQLACPFPVLAAVNGAAMGGGAEMALACDFAWAGESARMGLPEAGLGIIPGLGGTQLLTRAVGERRASEMLMSGLPVDRGGPAPGRGHGPGAVGVQPPLHHRGPARRRGGLQPEAARGLPGRLTVRRRPVPRRRRHPRRPR